jgi:phage baseplate assembly protein W
MNSSAASAIGQGIAFPLRTNVQGQLQISNQHQNLEESIKIILQTDIGERVYRPEFGSRLSELLFAPMNTQTLLLLRVYTEEALEKWEPRIVIDAIRTEPDPIRGCVEVILEYHSKDNHDQRSLVYPFYLREQG